MEVLPNGGLEMGKEEDFERLWEGVHNPNKARIFRNKLTQKVRHRGIKPTRENCKAYYCGEM